MDEGPEGDRTVDPLGEIPDENAFRELIEDLRDEGHSWNDIYEELMVAFLFVGQPAHAEAQAGEKEADGAKIQAAVSVLRLWQQDLTADSASPQEKYIGDAFGRCADHVEE